MDIKKTTHKMDDLGKTLILLFVMAFIASIVKVAFNEYQMNKQEFTVSDFSNEAEIDFTLSEFRESYVEGCMEGGEGFVSKEYCECYYDYITDHYTSKEILQMIAEGFEGEYSPSLEDAKEVCAGKLSNEAEIDFTSSEFKEGYVEVCMEEGEGFVSKEYCECCWDYTTDNYTSKEILQMMAEGFEGEYSPPLEDAKEVCAGKL